MLLDFHMFFFVLIVLTLFLHFPILTVDGIIRTSKFVGGVTVCALSGAIARKGYDMPWDVVAFVMIIGFLFGYAVLLMATSWCFLNEGRKERKESMFMERN